MRLPSPLYSLIKALYPGLGIIPLCKLVPYGSKRTGISNVTSLWPLYKTHGGENSKIRAFQAVFFGAVTTPAYQNHGSPPRCSDCIPMLLWDFNQAYLSSLDLEGGEWPLVCLAYPQRPLDISAGGSHFGQKWTFSVCGSIRRSSFSNILWS